MAAKKTTGVPRKSTTNPKGITLDVKEWFDRHFRVLSISVLCLAGLLRLSLLLELPEMPFHQLHKAPDLDMNFFDLWGDRIAQGDFLTDTILHPYHFWHDAISKAYGIEDEAAAKEKWNEWYGGKQYHQEPLYALLVGFAKIISPPGHLLIYILQMVLSLLSIWMIIWLGKHYFSAIAGILGGVLFTLYGPALLFDATLLRTSFSTTLMLGSIVLAEQLIQGRRKEWLMGIVGGAGYLLMTTSILLWLPLVIRWLIIRPAALRNAWKTGIAFGLFLSFLLYRNSVTETPLLSSSSVGPITYILSNFPEFEPEMGFVFFTGAGKIMEATGGQMIPSVIAIINQHDSVWSWIGLQFKKLGAVFHWYEIPNNVNTYLAREFSMTLKLTIIPYTLIAGLGMMGLFLNVTNKKTINLLAGILSQVAVMVIFYVLSRFRIPMVAMLCVYAGYTLHVLAGFMDKKKWVLTFAGSLILCLIIARPTPVIPATFTRGDLSASFSVYYLPKLDELAAKGDLNSCVLLLEEFLGTMPPYLRDEKQLADLDSSIKRDVAHYYGLVYGDLGNLYTEMGNEAKAKENLFMQAKLQKAGEQK